MVASADADGKTKTDAWIKAGLYSTGKQSKAIVATCAPHRFKSIASVTAEAAGLNRGRVSALNVLLSPNSTLMVRLW